MTIVKAMDRMQQFVSNIYIYIYMTTFLKREKLGNIFINYNWTLSVVLWQGKTIEYYVPAKATILIWRNLNTSNKNKKLLAFS